MKVYSFSKLQAYLQCPRKYSYERVHRYSVRYEGVPRPAGKATHKGVELLYLGQDRATAIDQAHREYYDESGLKAYMQEMAGSPEMPAIKQDVAKGWKQVEEILIKYKPPKSHEVVATELDITVDMGHGRGFRGILDRIVRINDDLWVPDTKTTGLPISKVQKVQRLRQQYPGYKLLAEQAGYDITGVILDLIYKPRIYVRKDGTMTVERGGPLFHMEPMHCSDQQVAQFKGWFHRIADEIERCHELDSITERQTLCGDRFVAEECGDPWPMNTDSCMAFNRVCPYFEACRSPERALQYLEASERFEKRPDREQPGSDS